MLDLPCPNCGSKYLQPDSDNEKAFCNKCQRTFELTEVNAWYKHMNVYLENVEFDKSV